MNIDQSQMLPIGTLLQDGKYRVEQFVASGGFGNTYVVEHVKLGKRLALKEFFMRNINLRQGTTVTVSVADNRDMFLQMKDKFFKEAQRLARLDDSHIVEVNDFFEENQTAYYVMRFIDGESLAQRMKRTGAPLSEADVVIILQQVLCALRTVHQQGLYHLDLKPGNIMQDRYGHCWLIDFGASKQLSAHDSMTLSTSTGLCYTPGFAPSEQVNGNTKRIGPWTDFYALGATLYNLLTGEAPPEVDDVMYDGEDAFHFTATVSPQLRQLIMWLMTPRYNQRPQSCDDIEKVMSQQSVDTVVATPRRTIQPEPILPETEPAPAPVESVETVVSNPEPAPVPVESVDTVVAAVPLDELPAVLQNLISNMVPVEGGVYEKGDSLSLWSTAEEIAVDSFLIGKYQVTQEEWQAVTGHNPSEHKGDRMPVEMVSWDDCQTFISRLNELTGMGFRLPTDDEWEFAARGGNMTHDFRCSGSDVADDVAWYGVNSLDRPHKVGQKLPNELGLYDMSGNVKEWCDSQYGNRSTKIVRGGCCFSIVHDILVSNSDEYLPATRLNYLGLRLAMSAVSK